MKKVLMVAYYYPPAAGVGTFRVTKFVKYLSSFGWEPYVLTVRDNYHQSKDESIFADTQKATKIYKTDISKLPINDVGLKWIKNLYREAKEVINKEKIDVVYYTGGPFFQWLVAPKLKKMTGVPYVIDYRDPWGINPYEENGKGLKKKIGDWLAGILEPKIIRESAGVIFATKDMENEYKKIFPGEVAKFSVIENGFDPDDYNAVIPKKLSGFSIVYTGKFSHYRNPESLLKAISIFRKSVDCQFIHVGNKEEAVSALASKYLGKGAIFTGPRTYAKAISYAKGADVLVLISGGSNIEFTHKVFDYVSCNKPIIAVVDKGSYLSKFLSNFENTFVVSNNAKEIEAALNIIYTKNIKNLGKDKGGLLGRYNRKNLTEILAKKLIAALEG
jgi:glycosyltransferase involved in cell wall biosynthesis